MKKIIIPLLLFVTINQSVFAADLEYPELNVTPRATDRVTTEAGKEKNLRWNMHLPIQVSSLVTLIGAFQHKDKPTSDGSSSGAQMLGIAVGAGWLVGTLALSNFYMPYTFAYQETYRMSAKSQREQLTRERVAEQYIEDAATLGSRLKWMSVASNFTANIFMFINAKKEASSKSTNILGVIGSFAPLVFESRWEKVANEHNDYKKRIYGPVAALGLTPLNATASEVAPTVLLSFQY